MSEAKAGRPAAKPLKAIERRIVCDIRMGLLLHERVVQACRLRDPDTISIVGVWRSTENFRALSPSNPPGRPASVFSCSGYVGNASRVRNRLSLPRALPHPLVRPVLRLQSTRGAAPGLGLRRPDRAFAPAFEPAAGIVVDEGGDRLQRVEQFDLAPFGQVRGAVDVFEQAVDTVLETQQLGARRNVQVRVARRGRDDIAPDVGLLAPDRARVTLRVDVIGRAHAGRQQHKKQR
ncbi:conserved hypothetical protein [Luteimonas sp. 9C]|nr:conserved hypothetical protein [Luteimonas sp. 9C]